METSGEPQKDEKLIELFHSFRDMFNFFCSNTTIHGSVRLVCSSRNRLKTAFWSLLFLATFGMLYWQFGLLFDQYWQYAVIVTVSVRSEPKMFPSITLCDMNPHRSQLVDQYLENLDEFAQENIYSLYKLNITRRQAGGPGGPAASPNSSLPFHLDRRIYLEELKEGNIHKVGFRLCNSTGGDCFYRNHSSGVAAIQEWYQFHFINIMAQLPHHNETSPIDHNGHFIFSCCYNGEACQKQDYEIFHHPLYGSCYTFNSRGMNDFWKAKRPGLTHGISLILKAEQNSYLPLLSTEAGVKVMIHAQNQVPFLEHQGFSIRPGTETTIGVREVSQGAGGAALGLSTADSTDDQSRECRRQRQRTWLRNSAA
ncbi:amiloride-sensitive sodium channel subunit delta [Monodelphis domestica]|nr:amiloride-sensitive sodium channel subunit delta [Monodelphis domestica]